MARSIPQAADSCWPRIRYRRRRLEGEHGQAIRLTKHALSRTQQRGFLEGDLSVVMRHGTQTRDGVRADGTRRRQGRC